MAETTMQPKADDARQGPIIRLVDLHKSFGALRVLDGIDLEVERGRSTVIIGPSGSGKSVLLKHIVGLIRPDSGEVWFEGQRIDRLSDPELVETRKRLGFLFQLGALFDSMNVGDNVRFPLVQHAKLSEEEMRERCASVLKIVGLEGVEQKMPSNLSGGQRKRVALARAVVLQPDVVLYDEPTTGLDPMRADVINELIRALGRQLGITSVVVTHDMASANKVGDRIVMLYGGKLIADGDPEQLRRHPNDLVQRFIHGEAEPDDLQHIQAGFTNGGSRSQPLNG
jgi:phospholipid/cholesterol/gamma-HCH transport system ATP-binding protein